MLALSLEVPYSFLAGVLPALSSALCWWPHGSKPGFCLLFCWPQQGGEVFSPIPLTPDLGQPSQPRFCTGAFPASSYSIGGFSRWASGGSLCLPQGPLPVPMCCLEAPSRSTDPSCASTCALPRLFFSAGSTNTNEVRCEIRNCIRSHFKIRPSR